MLFQIIFIDQDSKGELCSICKQEIKGKKWVIMLDFGDPLSNLPKPLDRVFCTECKIQFNDNHQKGVGRNGQKDIENGK